MGGLPKDHHPPQATHRLTRKLLTLSLYALLPLALLHFYFFPRPLPTPPIQTHLTTSVTNYPSLSPPAGGPSPHRGRAPAQCDYSVGRWVRAAGGPLYNGTSCAIIKDGQNCMAHGRPDTGYLHWRWRPRGCTLPPFDPDAFLPLLRGRHLAFVGDSMARNQLESLLCLLATASPPDLIYHDGQDNKFRRWRFPSHDATVSVFWSPFLVRGLEKSPAAGLDHNELYLDAVDERWASELGSIDMVVLSVGHWFLHPAVYYEKAGDLVLGCHYCPQLNHTEVGFYGVYRKAFRTALHAALTRHVGDRGRLVVVTTFSPAHFEGEWDKAGACPKTEPYAEGERAVEGMDAEMRRAQLEEVAAAAKKAKAAGVVAVEAVDVTGMALMRPDGHPGPYMYAFPFAGGVPERVQNDCVHWCLPGPIDAWNEVLLQVARRWAAPLGSGAPP
uniref:Diacylglycerol kinase n=1 Tax=Anthurium amnicola TaxID=1678845 RepID=A0A1D1XV47_9ARAE